MTIGTKGFVKYINHMGNDLMVVNAARVSFNKQSTERRPVIRKFLNMVQGFYQTREAGARR